MDEETTQSKNGSRAWLVGVLVVVAVVGWVLLREDGNQDQPPPLPEEPPTIAEPEPTGPEPRHEPPAPDEPQEEPNLPAAAEAMKASGDEYMRGARQCLREVQSLNPILAVEKLRQAVEKLEEARKYYDQAFLLAPQMPDLKKRMTAVTELLSTWRPRIEDQQEEEQD